MTTLSEVFVFTCFYFIIFVCPVTFLLLSFLYLNYLKKRACVPFVGKNVLFVTAHPDDECMFFAPCILHLSRLSSVHLLCLTSGKYPFHLLTNYRTSLISNTTAWHFSGWRWGYGGEGGGGYGVWGGGGGGGKWVLCLLFLSAQFSR